MRQVVKDETRVAIQVLARRANPGDGHFAKAVIDFAERFLACQTRIFVGRHEFHLGHPFSLVPGEGDHPELALLLGLTLYHQCLDLHGGQPLGPFRASIGLFDGAGEGRLGTHRDAGRGGGRSAGHKARRKNELVVRTERMARGGHFVVNDGRGQPSARKVLVSLR